MPSPPLGIGSKPVDGGNFIIDTDEERDAFLQNEPGAEPFLRPYIGADEFVNGKHRWILALHDINPSTLRGLPAVFERVRRVEQFRLGRTSEPTKKLAQTPTVYHVNVIPKKAFLVIPRHTSERRNYVPIGYVSPPHIPSDATIVLLEADLWHFGILTSRMHMAWLREVGGRLESRYRYSVGIVYNNFPWPTADEPTCDRIRALAEHVLDARAQFPDASLADLYDRLAMLLVLRKAHHALDVAIERLYRPAAFAEDVERVEHLLGMYEQLNAPLIAQVGKKTKRKRST